MFLKTSVFSNNQRAISDLKEKYNFCIIVELWAIGKKRDWNSII